MENDGKITPIQVRMRLRKQGDPRPLRTRERREAEGLEVLTRHARSFGGGWWKRGGGSCGRRNFTTMIP